MASILPISYPQAIGVLAPGAQFTMTDMFDYSTLQWFSPDIPIPDKAACDAEITDLQVQQPFAECKQEATRLLYETDWTTIADVANPQVSNPYLMNQPEFVAYRSQLRQLAVYPVANPVWPTKPTAIWSN